MSRATRNSPVTVMRSLTILSAAALALVGPVVALAAPTGGLRVSHPVLRTSGSMPALSSRTGSGAQEPFKVPFDLNAHPRSGELDADAASNPLRWRGWHPIPGSLLYQPVWFPGRCYANGGLAGPGAWSGTPTGTSAPPTNFTIGSLAGGKSSIFGSSASDIARVASSGGDAAATSSPLTLQFGGVTTPCGSANPFGF
jgi:hypothetical protein